MSQQSLSSGAGHPGFRVLDQCLECHGDEAVYVHTGVECSLVIGLHVSVDMSMHMQSIMPVSIPFEYGVMEKHDLPVVD